VCCVRTAQLDDSYIIINSSASASSNSSSSSQTAIQLAQQLC
jgi:hypothetical protein